MTSKTRYAQIVIALYDQTKIWLLKYRSTTSEHVQLLEQLERCWGDLILLEQDALPTFDTRYIKRILEKKKCIQSSDLQMYINRIDILSNINSK